MNYRYLLLFSALIFAQGCPAMQPQQPGSQVISSWQDLTPFAGKIVAFSSPGDWDSNFGTPGENKADDLYYAFVAPTTNRFYAWGEEPGYYIYPLIALNEKFTRLPYNIHETSIANRGILNMRLATPAEIYEIAGLIDAKENAFAFMPDNLEENIKIIFKQNLLKHP